MGLEYRIPLKLVRTLNLIQKSQERLPRGKNIEAIQVKKQYVWLGSRYSRQHFL